MLFWRICGKYSRGGYIFSVDLRPGPAGGSPGIFLEFCFEIGRGFGRGIVSKSVMDFLWNRSWICFGIGH